MIIVGVLLLGAVPAVFGDVISKIPVWSNSRPRKEFPTTPQAIGVVFV
jgi:hypothetical protein